MAFMGILLINLIYLILMLLAIIAIIAVGTILLVVGIVTKSIILKLLSLIILVPTFTILLVTIIKSAVKKSRNMKKMYYCMSEGKLKQAEKLLKKGASPDFTEKSNEPAKDGEKNYLMDLCYSPWKDKNGEKIQFLIEHGADIEHREFIHSKDAPSHFPKDTKVIYDDELRYKKYKCSNLDKCGMTPLMCAARVGNINAVKILIKNGADVNAVSYCGTTALMFAVNGNEQNSPEVVDILLENGADVNARDNFGFRVLNYAEYTKTFDKIKEYMIKEKNQSNQQ